MARRTVTIKGEVAVATVTKSNRSRWAIVSGTGQAILDWLDVNNIPEHKVKGTTLTTVTSTQYILVRVG